MSADPNAPLYQQLADELAAFIRQGQLLPGSQLPTVRSLAAERGVDVNTVSRAYRILAEQGLVEAHARRGTSVKRSLLPPPAASSIGDTTIRYVGSHDFCLDIVARLLRGRGVQLVLRVAGSSAGLAALASGAADLAGMHLLDPDGADYNCAAAARLVGGRDARLITLVEREQGLIVPRGNPRQLKGIRDLGRDNITVINRQAGSGTRQLFDRLLREENLDAARIIGYDRVVDTHVAAAAAVAGGSADAALGVHAAARALDLDFVPLARERFELVLLGEQLQAPWFGPLIETLATPAFRLEVEAIGGYDAARSAWIRRID